MLRAASPSTKGARFVAVFRVVVRHAPTGRGHAHCGNDAGRAAWSTTEPAAEVAVHADVDLSGSLVGSIAVYLREIEETMEHDS